MKKFAAVLAFGAALMSGAAYADTIANAYGNTIVVALPSGASIRYHFEADGTFTMLAPDGQTVSGTYAVADGQICLTPTGGAAQCTPYQGDKNVGETWTQTGADGSPITVSLVAGR